MQNLQPPSIPDPDSGWPWPEFGAALDSALLRSGFDYWRRLIRPGEALPRFGDFEPRGIARLLANVILLEVRHNPIDFRYRVIGQDVLNHLFGNYTGQWISAIPRQAEPGALIDNLRRAVEERRPLVPDIPYIGPKRHFKEIKVLFLPFAGEDGAVCRLLVFIDIIMLPGRLKPLI